MLGYPGAPNGTPAGQAHTVAVPVQGSGHVGGVKLPEGAFVCTCSVCAICANCACVRRLHPWPAGQTHCACDLAATVPPVHFTLASGS